MSGPIPPIESVPDLPVSATKSLLWPAIPEHDPSLRLGDISAHRRVAPLSWPPTRWATFIACPQLSPPVLLVVPRVVPTLSLPDGGQTVEHGRRSANDVMKTVYGSMGTERRTD